MQVAFSVRDDEAKPRVIRAQKILPDLSSGTPEEVWKNYFSEKDRTLKTVSKVIRKLNKQQKHKHIIAAIREALLTGHSQPWMYEVLAISMRIEGYPEKELERVLLSNVDFQATDVPHLLMSAAYLSRLGVKKQALKMYKQAAELAPTQPEPYLLSLKLTEELQQPEEIVWAATGILTTAIEEKYRPKRLQAENVLKQLIAKYQTQKPKVAKYIEQQLAAANQQDLRIKISWAGAGDVDLIVTEPGNSICSTQQRLSAGGGQFLHDGYGPKAENCFEEYVAIQAVPGTYKIECRHIQGDIVGNRIQVHIWRHAGSPHATEQKFHLPVKSESQTLKIRLPHGRRQLKESNSNVSLVPQKREAVSLISGTMAAATFKKATEKSRLHKQLNEIPTAFSNNGNSGNALRQQGNVNNFSNGNFSGGAVGYQPVVTTLSEGVSLGVTGVVSADRRYVRISTQPVFSNITDVFTFGIVQQNP